MIAFFHAVFSAPGGAIAVLLTLGVLFVNGWTDAPNAIAAAVSTGSLSLRAGTLLAAGMNVLGGLAALWIGRGVAETVYTLGRFSPGGGGQRALTAALLAVILWSVLAWFFGIPTSESHGLLAGLAGAALAEGGGLSSAGISKVLLGLTLSIGLGLAGGWFCAKRCLARPRTNTFWRRGQIGAAAATAFAHGLQDAPKFASVLLLCGGQETFRMPVWAPILAAVMMGAGTLLGGGRIIRTVGEKMVRLDTPAGFAADLAGTFGLFLSTLQGLPVSTTHFKTTALMGAAAAQENGFFDRKIAARMFGSWLLTFPACGGLAYVFTTLFLFLAK